MDLTGAEIAYDNPLRVITVIPQDAGNSTIEQPGWPAHPGLLNDRHGPARLCIDPIDTQLVPVITTLCQQPHAVR